MPNRHEWFLSSCPRNSCLFWTLTQDLKSRPMPRSALGKGVPSSEPTHPSLPARHAFPLPQTLCLRAAQFGSHRLGQWLPHKTIDLIPLLSILAFSRPMPLHWECGHCVPSLPIYLRLLSKYCNSTKSDLFYIWTVSSSHDPAPACHSASVCLGNSSSCHAQAPYLNSNWWPRGDRYYGSCNSG